MALPKLKTKISAATYLEQEKESATRNEFISGEVYAMAGSSDRHQFICSNLFVELFAHLRESKKCRVFMADMKVKVNEDKYYYPDVVVACDETPADPYFREEAVFIVEVASPSTRETDRREKLQAYQQMPSVQEYLLVEQDKMHIELHRRQPNGTWITYFYNRSDRDEAIVLESVGLSTGLDKIYDRVTFEQDNFA